MNEFNFIMLLTTPCLPVSTTAKLVFPYIGYIGGTYDWSFYRPELTQGRLTCEGVGNIIFQAINECLHVIMISEIIFLFLALINFLQLLENYTDPGLYFFFLITVSLYKLSHRCVLLLFRNRMKSVLENFNFRLSDVGLKRISERVVCLLNSAK